MGRVYKVMDRDGTEASGTITYDEERKEAHVALDIPKKRLDEIQKYFNAEQEFRIPESQELDDFRIDRVKPVENADYFNLAMCSLYAATGIYVLWGE